MKLPPTNRILREDVKEAPQWVGGIIDPVNSFMENTYQALNKNITFSENILSFIKVISYRTTSIYPVADDISFTNDLKVKATGVILLQAVDTNYEPAAGPVYIPWVENNQMIVVKAITGLEAEKTYRITLLII